MTDIVTYCDVNTCEDCPRYSDDCDGDKRVEHTDTISRADAIECCQCHGSLDCINRIKALPSADAVQGEWTYLSGSKGSYMTISCPICGSTFNDVAEWKYNFCPNCGARMKGGEK